MNCKDPELTNIDDCKVVIYNILKDFDTGNHGVQMYTHQCFFQKTVKSMSKIKHKLVTNIKLHEKLRTVAKLQP